MPESGAHTLITEDVIIVSIMLGTEQACSQWAQVSYAHDGPDADPVVTPHADKPGIGLTVTSEVVRLGLRRIGATRSNDLPPGISRITQQAVLEALREGRAGGLWPIDVDQIIQVGLFGEVKY